MSATGKPNLKKIVAEKAVEDYVRDGMTVGLGTGTTADFAIRKIAELAAGGADLACVATSLASERLASSLGLKVSPLSDVECVDVTIDGADEVDPSLQLIKGLGGALLREKIVAAATVQEIIIVDESKLVGKLGSRCPLPVEVVAFGHSKTKYALERQGCSAELRMAGGEPFVTDGGNYVYDCRFPPIDSPFFLESRIDVIPGVVENGLFLNMAAAALVSHADGRITRMSKGSEPETVSL
ncbi:MAG: ribose-5-phosphate isomerase RpiA [Candidatus Methanoplasma sp.]|jgi:ribose 5-phosphate isomerase A|nr:ribose-5-phosphate isomerase RpiA [Candidatus Methanoplasma sp.]